MYITFVHTPMPLIEVPEMKLFWRNFDVQYHGAHPGLRHMKNVLWELPHWMHWLAGILQHEGSYSFDVVDFYTTGTSFDGIDELKVKEVLADHAADVYMFSPMTPNLPFALEIADQIKLLDPRSTIIFGGVVASPLHLQVAGHPSVDYVVSDRAEYALPALLKAVLKGESVAHIGNLTWKNGGEEVLTSAFTYPAPFLDAIPFPKVDLFPRSAGNDIRYLRQVFALGCPYECAYCTIQTIAQKPDYFPIERVLAEIRAYRSYYGEHHYIYWGDETFGLHEKRTLELCEALRNEGRISYDCQTRLNCLDNGEILKALAESGCKWIEIGIETGNSGTQKLFKQGVALEKTEERLMRLRDHGIAACAYMVNGFPDQTVSDMKQSLEWACRLITKDLLQASYWFGLVPYPGSDMYHHPEKYGMRLHHSKFKFYNEELPPVFDTRHANSDEIYEVYRSGIVQLSEAMSKKPYFGASPSKEDLPAYGAFWAHV